MPFKIKAQVEGAKEVLAAIGGLADKLKKKLLKKAVGEAGRLVLKRAKQLVPRDSGLLKKSLGRKVKVYRNTGTAVAIVGPRKGFRQPVTRAKGRWKPRTETADPIKYAHLIEQGTGHSQAKPFLRPAIEGQQQQIREAMASVIARGIEQDRQGK